MKKQVKKIHPSSKGKQAMKTGMAAEFTSDGGRSWHVCEVSVECVYVLCVSVSVHVCAMES